MVPGSGLGSLTYFFYDLGRITKGSWSISLLICKVKDDDDDDLKIIKPALANSELL